MARFVAQARFIVGALALMFIVAIAAPALAQQAPNPTASSVREEQLLQEQNRISGRCTLPDQKACTIEQPVGRDWRRFHEAILPWLGAIAIIGMLALLVVYHLRHGMVRIESGRSGRRIVRFDAFERFVHWMTAISFITLAITGLNITFGKRILMPLLGPETFTGWSQWAKYIHDYASFPFTIGVVLIFFMWLTGNLPNKTDVDWVKRGGGLVGNDHPPAYRFNAGQKMVYWIVVIGGTAVAITGYLLMFPFYGTTIAGMQLAQIIHAVVGVLFVAVMLAHIYIGTLGMEGAFDAMAVGTVDQNWAKQHHSLWLDEELARGERRQPPIEGQARPTGTPAE
jgi:formate dehydrogenase subunit gamma